MFSRMEMVDVPHLVTRVNDMGSFSGDQMVNYYQHIALYHPVSQNMKSFAGLMFSCMKVVYDLKYLLYIYIYIYIDTKIDDTSHFDICFENVRQI